MSSSLPLMDLPSSRALFARASRNSARVILPLNGAALDEKNRGAAFYCVHPVSGVAGTEFLDLASRLDPSVRFFGIQAPLDEMENPDFGRTLESIGNYYTEILLKFQPSGPLMVGGYCLGAVIALVIANNLRAQGREVGPLIAIDGAPENVAAVLRPWSARYLVELARNVPGWIGHSDLARHTSLSLLLSSLVRNGMAIGKGVLGLKRGQKLGGGYSIDGIMDLSMYPPAHQLFINRIFAALYDYVPESYLGPTVVYEAKTTNLIYLPQVGRIWLQFAPRTEVVKILGTHIGIMRPPYVEVLASNLLPRIEAFFSAALDSSGNPNHAGASSAIPLAFASAVPKIVSSTESRS